MRRITTIVTTVAAAAAATLISAGPAAAANPPGCSSVSQVGSAGYIKLNGTTIASVKQYYGCGKNYSYVWVWETYRDRGWSSVYTAVVTREGDRHGGVSKARPAYEVWSNGASTADRCTRAVGQILINGQSYAANTSEVC
ncbi:hypothetical protein ACFZCT_37720 [Streptomyces qaidamensis]|uniref:hypothetical protein n=1 Tax=Streptomyces qaidamensis TaxID=1783515 RepID=UPI0036EDAAE6